MYRQYFEKKKRKLGLVSIGETPQAVYRQLGEARKRRRKQQQQQQPAAASVVEQPAPAPATTTTLLYRCRKCDGRECVFTQVQTRSADEAMTTFLRCTQCGYSWKE